MPHPEAQHETKPALQLTPREMTIAVIVAVVTVVATLGSLYRSRGDEPLSVAAQQARLQAFRQSQPLSLSMVPPNERAEALATMQLSTQLAGVRQAVEDSRQQLAWLILWDDMVEDGDTVEIVSDGYVRTVRLTNAPIRFAVPVPERGVIDLRGIYDGGGGITMAMMTSTGKVALPIIEVGAVIGVPVQTSP